MSFFVGIQAWVACWVLYVAGVLFQALYRILHYAHSLCHGTHASHLQPRESAILIIGAEGQNGLSMRLSNLGYTIFAIFRSACGSKDSAEIQTILRSWHQLKEASPQATWGLVAPMTADFALAADRKRVYETIAAYCSHHSLNLVSVIHSPEIPTVKGPKNISMRALLFHQGEALQLGMENLQKSVRDDILEPNLILKDYLTLLSKSSGNAIIISEMNGHNLSVRYRQATARNMHDELYHLGIEVVSVISGPRYLLKPRQHRPSRRRKDFSISAFKSTIWYIWHSIGHPHEAYQWLMATFHISEDEYFTCIERIVQARNIPRQQVIGTYPFTKYLISQYPWLNGYLSPQ